METDLYLYLKAKAFDKARPAMKEEGDATYTDEEQAKDPTLVYQETDAKFKIEEIDWDESKLHVSVTGKLGDIFFDIRLDTEMMLSLIELSTKKLNKFKTILEAVK